MSTSGPRRRIAGGVRAAAGGGEVGGGSAQAGSATGSRPTSARPAGRDSIILGADTTVVVDGEILGKPRDDDEAAAMLRRLSGGRTRC